MTSRLFSQTHGRNSLIQVFQENGIRSITLADTKTRYFEVTLSFGQGTWQSYYRSDSMKYDHAIFL